MSEKPQDLGDDLLYGAEAIGAYIRRSERQIYHAAAHGHLPIGKMGGVLIARRSELDAATRARPIRVRSGREG